MKNIEMTAVFEPCVEGGYIAYVQEIPGINTQGETLEEAKENLTDAVNLVFGIGKISTIPRHPDIKENLCRKICKDLGIPDILKP